MSHLTDAARAPYRDAEPTIECADSLEAIVAANPSRRSILKNGLYSLAAMPLMGALAACDDDDNNGTQTPTPPPAPTPPSYAINFASVAANQDDKVTVPTGYTVDLLLKAGDSIEPGTAYSDSAALPTNFSAISGWAGGNHDGMEYFSLPNVDPNTGGLLAINFELPDWNILFPAGAPLFASNGNFLPAAATREQINIALSGVGVGVVEIAKGTDGKFAVKANSAYNRRYSGNTFFEVGGPAANSLPAQVKGTLNNCSSGRTPWGTYLTCEETTSNYLDPSQPATGYGWVVEIDPLNELAEPTKRTALGRFSHENTAYMTNSANRVAFYMGDDTTPGCIYKFIPNRSFSPTNRSANRDLLDNGTLYVAQFTADGKGRWIALVQGQNGLTAGATDPGTPLQQAGSSFVAPSTFDFTSQADVLINCQRAARVAGGTVMDRPEWITVAPNNQSIFVTLTNNSSRGTADAANPRVSNLHGHILKFREDGDSPLATTFTWEIFMQAGFATGTAGAAANLIGNTNGDTMSSPDGIRMDPQGRLWVQTDHSVPGTAGNGQTIDTAFGHNAMFHIDPTTKLSKRFLVGPLGQEITGLAYTPDLKTFFINIQHPTGNWPVAGERPRSTTIVVRRTDAQPVGN